MINQTELHAWLGNGSWNEEKNLNDVRRKQDWEIQRLIASNNERPTLGSEIEHIRFPNLTYLHLEGNKIQSLEAFDFIIAPNLAHLFIHNNSIISVAALKKVHWPFLSVLQINKNYICQHQTLCQGYFPQFHLLLLLTDDSKDKVTDPSFAFKLQAPSVAYLRLVASSFALQRSILKKLCIKWPRIEVD